MFFLYGILAALILVFLVLLVYFRNHKYGYALAALSLVLIGLAAYLNLSEDTRVAKAKQKIPPEQVQLSELILLPAYGNYYQVKAKAKNTSDDYQAISIDLKLDLLSCEKAPCAVQKSVTNTIKLWLKPQQAKAFESYFNVEQLAVERSKKEWKLGLVSVKAK